MVSDTVETSDIPDHLTPATLIPFQHSSQFQIYSSTPPIQAYIHHCITNISYPYTKAYH